MIPRRAILGFPLAFAASCARTVSGYRGYAFVANEDGHAIAAVDLQALAVAKHIALDAAPTQVAASWTRPAIYALTPANGSLQEIESDRLAFRRKLSPVSTALSMRLDPTARAMYLLASDPRALVRINLDAFRVEWTLPLPEIPTDFDIASKGNIAAVALPSGIRFLDLGTRKLGHPIDPGNFGAVQFRADGQALIAAGRAERRLSLYDTSSQQLITRLPLAVRPDHLSFSRDGGQLYITGEGMDAVVIVYPYNTPEVAQTVLAGHAPGPMAASDDYLFIASPSSGDVSILNIATQKVMAVVPVGSDPGFVTVTPDDQYALVLNRKSGDMAVLRVGAIQPNRNKSAAVLTMIPVGSRPVNAAIQAV